MPRGSVAFLTACSKLLHLLAELAEQVTQLTLISMHFTDLYLQYAKLAIQA